MTTSMRGLQAAFPTSGIHLIIGNVRQFDSPHFYHWAEGFSLVTESWLLYIPEVTQSARKPEAMNVKIRVTRTSESFSKSHLEGL